MMLRQALGVRAGLLQEFESYPEAQQALVKPALHKLLNDVDKLVGDIAIKLARKDTPFDKRLERLMHAEEKVANISTRLNHTAASSSPDSSSTLPSAVPLSLSTELSSLRDLHANLTADFFSFDPQQQKAFESIYTRVLDSLEQLIIKLAARARSASEKLDREAMAAVDAKGEEASNDPEQLESSSKDTENPNLESEEKPSVTLLSPIPRQL